MGARKLYEEKISDLVKKTSEEDLENVVSMLEKIHEEKKQNYLQAIEEGFGKYRDAFSPVEEFLRRKHEDKLLDR